MGKNALQEGPIRADLQLLVKKAIHFDRTILEHFL